MQEEVNDKTIALSVKSAKLTANVLKAAMKKFLAEYEKSRQKSKTKSVQPKHGKQTVKQLMKSNQQLTNIEVTDGNIKSFEKVARKYGIDFGLKKDTSVTPPKYMVFFKAKDVDVMTAAFKEYTANDLKKTNKPSLRKRLAKAMETVCRHKEKVKEKNKNRGQQSL